VVYLINRSPSHALDGDIPEMIWKYTNISYDHLRVFGYRAFVHIPKDGRSSLIARPRSAFSWGIKMVNLGISCGILLRRS
jgi:hypothetical protein